MSMELKIPSVGESISEVTIGEWLKSEGDWVDKDEPVVALETDKASLEVPAPEAGKLTKLVKKAGDSAEVGEVIAYIDAEAAPAGGAEAEEEKKARKAKKADKERSKKEKRQKKEEKKDRKAGKAGPAERGAATATEVRVMPAARRLLEEHGLSPDEVEATGPGGRLLKSDVLRHVEGAAPTGDGAGRRAAPAAEPGRGEEVVPMTPLRRRIAARLVESQRESATLTTFNEVDMSAVIALRQQYKEAFTGKHGIKLGFMSFFVKAAIEALKEFPEVNAEIRGTDIVYRDYYDIGVAVGGGRGLVVPVIRNAERLSFAEVEETIYDFAVRARDNKLKLEELTGGTFTISNGGVYGSLLSTPIINPPQVGILGMHKIEERPVAVNGKVEIRPMMYVALSYDHRVIDGRESVSFLLRIKECIEDPSRILLEV